MKRAAEILADGGMLIVPGDLWARIEADPASLERFKQIFSTAKVVVRRDLPGDQLFAVRIQDGRRLR